MEPSSQMFTQGGILSRDWFSDRLQQRPGKAKEKDIVRREEEGREAEDKSSGLGNRHQDTGKQAYLLRALHISMVTSTDKAMVMGSGASKTSQSTPSKSRLCSAHCMK